MSKVNFYHVNYFLFCALYQINTENDEVEYTMNTISLTKSEGYSFGVVRASVRLSIPSIHTFCPSGTISQYILIRFDLFLVHMIRIMYLRYPISLVKIDRLTLELLPLF